MSSGNVSGHGLFSPVDPAVKGVCFHSWASSMGPAASIASRNLCSWPFAVMFAEQGYSNLMQRPHRRPGHVRSRGVH